MLDPSRLDPDAQVRLREALALLQSGQARAAVPLLDQERTRLRDHDPTLAAAVGVHLAQAYVATGQRWAALETLEEDARSLPKDGDQEQQALRSRIFLEAAQLHPESELAFRLAAEADRLAATLEDPRPRLHTLAGLHRLLAREGRTRDAAQVAQFLFDQAEIAEDEAAGVQALTARAEALLDHDPLQALATARSAHAGALRLADPQLRAKAAEVRGRAARQTGALLEALECLDQAAAETATVTDALRLERALAAAGLGVRHHDVRADLQRVAAGEDAELARRARRALALLLLDAGEAEAVQALIPTLDLPDDRQAIQARLLLHQGEAQKAAELLADLSLRSPRDRSLALSRAEALRRAGQPLEALNILDPLVETALAEADAWLELRGRLGRAPVLDDLGDAEASRQDARRAAELAAQAYLPVQHALARTLVAQALARLDLHDEALAELEEAAAFASRLGASGEALRLTLLAALADSGPTTRALGDGGVAAAIERAQEVAAPGLLTATLLVLASRALAHDGEVELALALLDKARALDEAHGGTFRSQVEVVQAAIDQAEAR